MRRVWKLSPAVAAIGMTCVMHAAAAGDLALGQYLSSECVTCHQATGKAAGGVPFIAVMNAYKNRDRDNPVMRNVAGRLGEQDIAALAAYFGRQIESEISKQSVTNKQGLTKAKTRTNK